MMIRLALVLALLLASCSPPEPPLQHSTYVFFYGSEVCFVTDCDERAAFFHRFECFSVTPGYINKYSIDHLQIRACGAPSKGPRR